MDSQMKYFNIFVTCLTGVICLVLSGCSPSKAECQPIENPISVIDSPENWKLYLGPNIEVQQVCTFKGRVKRGQTYKQQITENLAFCLLPQKFFSGEITGWQMRISDDLSDDCEENFGPIANPPFHMNNLFEIHGWQYRNKDNTGEAISPNFEKRFHFLLNEADYLTAMNYYWREEGQTDGNSVEKIDITKIPRSVGIIQISDLELGNLIPNERAWIEWMDFEVAIYLPSN